MIKDGSFLLPTDFQGGETYEKSIRQEALIGFWKIWFCRHFDYPSYSKSITFSYSVNP